MDRESDDEAGSAPRLQRSNTPLSPDREVLAVADRLHGPRAPRVTGEWRGPVDASLRERRLRHSHST